MAWKWSGGSKGAGNVSASDEWTGFFDQGVSLEGTLQLSGMFRLNGQVKGNIISEQSLILGENAKVEMDTAPVWIVRNNVPSLRQTSWSCTTWLAISVIGIEKKREAPPCRNSTAASQRCDRVSMTTDFA